MAKNVFRCTLIVKGEWDDLTAFFEALEKAGVPFTDVQCSDTKFFKFCIRPDDLDAAQNIILNLKFEVVSVSMG